MMMRWLVFLILIVVCVEGVAAVVVVNALSCNTALRSDLNRNEAVIGVLKDLFNGHHLTSQDLITILSGKNPLAQLNTPFALEFRGVIDQVINSIHSDPANLTPLVQKLIDESMQQFVERTHIENETKEKLLPLTFYPIAAGSFAVERPFLDSNLIALKPRVVEIKNPFWIADYPVLQWQYARLMYINPSVHKTGPGEINLEILNIHSGEKLEIQMRPNNPVENTYPQTELAFIDSLNSLSDRDDPSIYEIIPAHKKHWHFRKPTTAEWEFVARNRGQWRGVFPDGITDSNLGRIAWYCENANGSTHSVGQLEPILIDGVYPIYDLYGNVSERTEDLRVCGGSWADVAIFLKPGRLEGGNQAIFSKHNYLGFRLITEPPP